MSGIVVSRSGGGWPGCRSHQRDPISVCHLSDGEAWAGAEVQMTTLLRALLRYHNLLIHAILFHEGRLAEELRNVGVAVRVIPKNQSSLAELIRESRNVLMREKIRILHSHSYRENLIAFLLSRVCKVPYVVRTEHGHPEPYSVVSAPKHWCVLAADKLVAKCSTSQIIAVSADLGDAWARRVGVKKVKVLRNGVDLDMVNSSRNRSQAKEQLGIPAGSPVIGSVARLEPVKRIDLFIAAAGYVIGQIPDAHFIVAGEGRERRALEHQIKQAGLEHCVHMVGECREIYDVLRAMDVLLICSDHEGIPMTMLEAMALRVAVVSRDIGGVPEVIRHGVNGILVSSNRPEHLGSACIAVLNNPRLQMKLEEAAYHEITSTFSAQVNAAAMFTVYSSLCGRPVGISGQEHVMQSHDSM